MEDLRHKNPKNYSWRWNIQISIIADLPPQEHSAQTDSKMKFYPLRKNALRSKIWP